MLAHSGRVVSAACHLVRTVHSMKKCRFMPDGITRFSPATPRTPSTVRKDSAPTDNRGPCNFCSHYSERRATKLPTLLDGLPVVIGDDQGSERVHTTAERGYRRSAQPPVGKQKIRQSLEKVLFMRMGGRVSARSRRNCSFRAVRLAPVSHRRSEIRREARTSCARGPQTITDRGGGPCVRRTPFPRRRLEAWPRSVP